MNIWIQTGADYGLGTIGMCLGPPPAGGPHLTENKEKLFDYNEKGEEKITRTGKSYYHRNWFNQVIGLHPPRRALTDR